MTASNMGGSGHRRFEVL